MGSSYTFPKIFGKARAFDIVMRGTTVNAELAK
jgi:hypothetical protein